MRATDPCRLGGWLALGAIALAACAGPPPAASAGRPASAGTVETVTHVYATSAPPASPNPGQADVASPPVALPPASPAATPSPAASPPASVAPPVMPTAAPAPTPAVPREVLTLAGSPDPAGAAPGGFADGPGAAARFFGPAGLAYGGGRLVLADARNNRIRELRLDAQGLATVVTLAGGAGPGATDGLAANARFAAPAGVALDPTDPGHLAYIADTANNAIRQLRKDAAGDWLVTTLAGGSAGFADGAGAAARFDGPAALAAEATPQGTLLYVADANNHAIRKLLLASDGVAVTTLAGVPAPGFSDGAAARFDLPRGLATDGHGTVYVADTGNHALRAIAPDGTTTTLAGNGQPGFGEVDAAASAAATPAAVFNQPVGLAVDAHDPRAVWLYVADTGNHRICRVTLAGQVTTVAGSGSQGDDDGANASFMRPTGLAIDLADPLHARLYVGDTGNEQVRLLR